MKLLNSIVGGFGSQIGRTAARKMLNSSNSVSLTETASNSLSFGQIVKTFLWSLGMFLLAMFLSAFIVPIVHGLNLSKDLELSYMFKYTLPLWVLFTFVIGRGYYTENKKQNGLNLAYIEHQNEQTSIIAEAQNLIKQIEQSYTSNGITKREYEVLISKANKTIKNASKLI